ncbi:MAG: NAD-dependent succinate-semialdehyde dehydrogenase [Gammaproteobacteria bacterium]|nr:MAG: NAD-dependent succinate-semialdehyde dehydrogenase [Gammaproteobacteria bacterium]
MAFESINPATDEHLASFEAWDAARIEQALAAADRARPQWHQTPLEERCALLRRTAEVLRAQEAELARLITLEMGKLYREARAEIEKCAWVCEYYADEAARFLADEVIETDATRSFVAYQPLGTVLAVMPWNFPFWQVFRFAAPALAAGNTGLLKHASNVPQCALAIERVFREAGAPEGVFTTLMIRASQVEGVIRDPRVHAVTLTGSEPAGRSVASIAASEIKKSVLELGGSDAFVVLEDADLEWTVQQGVMSRFLNAGQSCIAAKRFIIVDAIAEDFLERFRAGVEALQVGDPFDDSTSLGPMARRDLRAELHQQVQDSIAAGAVAVTGCHEIEGPGAFYAPSIIDRVQPGQRAWEEELFGPVAIVIRARDEAHALEIANGSRFGLGGSVWTGDSARGEAFARRMQCGAAFVNGLVKSDPRLPFGGVKASGYGRELSHHGLHEFLNIKTIWIR